MTACCGKDVLALIASGRAIIVKLKVSACYEVELGECSHREVGGYAQVEA